MAEPIRRVDDLPSLRALAHPVRMALIEALAVHGQLTATRAGELLGQSPSNCSFHLRQLARFGLIEPVGPSGGRQRPWQIVAGGIGVDPDALGDNEFTAAAVAIDEVWIGRQAAAETAWAHRLGSEARDWQRAAYSSWTVRWLTAAELATLQADVAELLTRHRDRRDAARRPAGTRPVRIYTSAFPVYPADTDEGH